MNLNDHHYLALAIPLCVVRALAEGGDPVWEFDRTHGDGAATVASLCAALGRGVR